MTTKLTLSVEKTVIQNAKLYARRQKRSLSEIVASYLRGLSAEPDASEELDPEVMAIADEIPPGRIPELENARYQYLKEKYLHE
jgi:hypothetical protein